MLRVLPLVLLLCPTLLAPKPVSAFPGDLDGSFGTNGVVVDATLGGGRALALRADRRIVVVHEDGKLTRFLPNGARDPSFGTEGVVTLPFPGYAVALQTDGMIVVAGGAAGTFALARYDAGGTLDPLFGDGGIATLPLATRGYAAAILVQSTGAIVVGGVPSNAHEPWRITLARFTAAGTLDASFGTAGTVVDSEDASSERVAIAATTADGFVVLGSVGGATVLRFDANGAPDLGFATGGRYWRGDFDGLDVTVQLDGAVVVAGSVDFLTIATLRLDAAGLVDTAFGDGGTVNELRGFSWGTSVVLEPSGDVVVGGTVVRDEENGALQSNFGVFRYAPSGTPDATFGSAGVAATELGGDEGINDVARDGDSLLVAGVRGSEGLGADHLVLARYDLGPLCRSRPTCKAAPPGQSMLDRRKGADPPKHRWRWTFRRGGATTLAELGDPRASERYALCAFDDAGAVVAAVPIGPGGCDASSCWRAVANTGFRYRGRPDATAGIAAITMHAGAAGRAAVTVDARGAGIPGALLAERLPFSVQLQASHGACFTAAFSSSGIRRNDGSRLRVASD